MKRCASFALALSLAMLIGGRLEAADQKLRVFVTAMIRPTAPTA